MNKLDKNTTIHVKVVGVKELTIRLKIASIFFHLGAAILGCGIEIDQQNETKENSELDIDRPKPIEHPYMIHDI
jgi:hypothetical protein